MNRDSNQAAGNLVFFLIGAAVGAGVALLYAPQEGEETRRLIGEKAHVARDKAAEVSETVANSAKEKWTAVADSVSEMVSHVPRFAQKDGSHLESGMEAVSASSES